MEKPTIFFSHSSKDRNLILPIKNKLSNITSNTIKIFMSSDGQSIPFGNNWIHKIEEGLSDSKVMFVFVTQNSVNNAWVYFESGYAYSKGIEVVPVGIGIDIGELKPPLNLLQGFNILSGDSLNNFVTILNGKFDCDFKDDFSHSDYEQVKAIELQSEYNISEIFTSAIYGMCSQYSDEEKGIIRYDLEKIIEGCKKFLDKENIKFSSNNSDWDGETILVDGIKLKRTGKEKEPEERNGKIFVNQDHKLRMEISTYNFLPSFDLIKRMISTINLKKFTYLNFHFTEEYDCIRKDIELSAVLGEHSDIFSPANESIGTFYYKDLLAFGIYNHHLNKDVKPVLGVGFSKSKSPSTDIIDLISTIVDLGVIFPK